MLVRLLEEAMTGGIMSVIVDKLNKYAHQKIEELKSEFSMMKKGF